MFGELWYWQDGSKNALLTQGLGTLWTEHSERMTMRTWAQAARIPEDVRKQMGRWQPSADEGYERGARLNVLRAQKVIAEFIKNNKCKADPFDEESVLALVELKMQAEGYERKDIKDQLETLACFERAAEFALEVEMPEWTTTGPVKFRDAWDDKPASVTYLDDGCDDTEEELAASESGQPAQAQNFLGKYIVSIVGRSKTRALHRAGECYREPGVHYNHYEVLGDEPPSTDAYHKACKSCFPKGEHERVGAPEEESSGEVSSSDSTDTSGED